MYGWTGQVLHVDLTTRDVSITETDSRGMRMFIGGRGLNSYTLFNTVKPDIDPLGPENALMFATGPVGGTLSPSSGRFTVTAVSPLTLVAGGTKPCFGDSNCGGFFGPEMKYAGFDQFIITGQSDRPVYLLVTDNKAEIRDARHLQGLDTWATEEALKKELKDPNIQVASIGPAGENLVRTAAIMTNQSRAAGKCGLGTVMGSKKLKAVVVRGTMGVKVKDPDGLRKCVADAIRNLQQDPSSVTYSRFGTSSLLSAHQKAGRLATRNYQDSQFDFADEIDSKALGKYWRQSAACFACPLHCSHHYEVKEGEFAGTIGEGGPEYVTLASFGSKIGNRNLPSILFANNLCNKLGLDTQNTGSAIAWAMECRQRGLLNPSETDGLDLQWGNYHDVLTLVERIAKRQGDFASLLAEGAYRAARTLGRGSELYVNHVKGQDPGLSDPRTAPAWGLGYAVASRGGCHLRALPSSETFFSPQEAREMFGTEEAVAPDGVKGKGRLIKWSEDQRAVADSLETCKFIVRTGLIYPRFQAEFLNTVTGEDYTSESIMEAGERIIAIERAFNVRQGLTPADDTLSHRFLHEPVSSGPAKGRVNNLGPMLEEYYEARQWSLDTGYPHEGRLRDLKLDWVADEMARMGRVERVPHERLETRKED
jgi:aldehyde:ferredoxin oxidoreductase